MPPTVVPFSFPREVKEGEKIFVTCVVSQGDAPMRLQWLKNAQVVGDTTASPRKENKSGVKHPSDLRSDLSIHRIGDSDALVLQITHVKFEHGSNWTCKAKNPFGTQEYTQQLVVHGKTIEFHSYNITIHIHFLSTSHEHTIDWQQRDHATFLPQDE